MGNGSGRALGRILYHRASRPASCNEFASLISDTPSRLPAHRHPRKGGFPFCANAASGTASTGYLDLLSQTSEICEISEVCSCKSAAPSLLDETELVETATPAPRAEGQLELETIPNLQYNPALNLQGDIIFL